MERAAATGGETAPPPSSPDVIVISDDESAGNEEAPSSNALAPFTWTDVADRLRGLAKNRELRDDQPVVDSLLRDVGIPPTSGVRRSLRAACEKLGELLVHLRGHDRRCQASEGLVMVVCEVLSLVRTAPCQKQGPLCKKEGGLSRTHCQPQACLYRLMGKWISIIVALAHSQDSRAYTMSVTMSRLESLTATCTREIEHLQDAIGRYEEEKESAAEEFVAITDECKTKLETEGLGVGERALRVLVATLDKTGHVQSKFQASSDALTWMACHAQEVELRRDFYRAVLTLACTATQLIDVNDHAEQQHMTTEERINVLGDSMLEDMDNFCAALQAIMVHSLHSRGDFAGPTRRELNQAKTADQEQLPELELVAKHLEAFWLIHRNWLQPVVVDIFTRSFDILVESDARAECPVGNAVSRVCASLRAGYLIQE
ncbi:hypothetical protein PHYPSEUDO_000094 [Phytophthora pseudosyringae]|uniref:Uncharacterized protein n=1 Tax=Phytophthora pseudosyringae TaxID=221518 RepID=A0A8T1WJ17_9STRA|nr:hypothetical protein PHYPSEUDO_000094 [Phytophthora pseudosyringae]